MQSATSVVVYFEPVCYVELSPFVIHSLGLVVCAIFGFCYVQFQACVVCFSVRLLCFYVCVCVVFALVKTQVFLCFHCA